MEYLAPMKSIFKLIEFKERQLSDMREELEQWKTSAESYQNLYIKALKKTPK